MKDFNIEEFDMENYTLYNGETGEVLLKGKIVSEEELKVGFKNSPENK